MRQQCSGVRTRHISLSEIIITSHLFYNQQLEPPFNYLQLHVGQSPRYMESCPRFEYLFLATYSSLPTTRPFLGPAVYSPTRRTTLSLAGPTRISPPSVSPVPAFRPAIRRLPLGIYTYFYLRHCPSYHRKTNPQPFLSHGQPLHITQRDLWPIGVIAIWPLQKTLLSTTTPAPSWFDLLLPFSLYRCGKSPNAFASHGATTHITNRELSYIGAWEVETPKTPENASGPLAIVTRGLLPTRPVLGFH
jgi:hypothetical protein